MSVQSIYKTIIEHRIDSYSNWASHNIILKEGELGFFNQALTEETNIRGLVVGDGVSTFKELYPYETSGKTPLVFFSGIGAGYVLPAATLNTEEDTIGGIVANNDYYNLANGLLSNKYYTIGGAIVKSEVTYNHQWNFDSDVYVNIKAAKIDTLESKTEIIIKNTSELLQIHTGESQSSTTTKEITLNYVSTASGIATYSGSYTLSGDVSNVQADTIIVPNYNYSISDFENWTDEDNNLVECTVTSNKDAETTQNITDYLDSEGKYTHSFTVDDSDGVPIDITYAASYQSQYEPGTVTRCEYVAESHAIVVEVEDGDPETGLEIGISYTILHYKTATFSSTGFWDFSAGAITSSGTGLTPIYDNSLATTATLTYSGKYKEVDLLAFVLREEDDDQTLNATFDTTTKIVKLTFTETENNLLDLDDDNIPSLPQKFKYSTTEIPVLDDDELEGIALYNYCEKTESETERPYAVLGIDNTGELYYTPSYDGSKSGSDIKKIFYVENVSQSGLLKFNSGTQKINPVAYQLDLIPSNSVNTDTITFDYSQNRQVYIPNQFCTNIKIGTNTINLDTDYRTIDMSDYSCKTITVNSGASTTTYNVEDGIIEMDLPVWTETAEELLNSTHEQSETNKTDIANIKTQIASEITSIKLDGETYSPTNHVATMYSMPSLTSSGSSISITKDTTNHIINLEHYSPSLPTDTTPAAVDIESITGNAFTYYSSLGWDNKGHFNTITKEKVSFQKLLNRIPELPDTTTDGTYILKAVKLSGQVEYSWVKQS